MNSNTHYFFQPLDGPIQTLQRVGVIYWQSGTVRFFFKIALFFIVPATAILLALVYTVLHNHHHNQSSSSTTTGFWRTFKSYATILGGQAFIQQTLGAIAEAAISVAVADLYLNRQPRTFLCLQKASAKAVTLLIAGIISGTAILIGYFFLYLPGLFLKLNFMLVTPVIVLEDELSVLSSLGRSWDLVKGHRRWYVLQCLLGLDVLYWIATWIIGSFLNSNNNNGDVGGDNDSSSTSRPFFSLTYHLLQAVPYSVFVPALGILKTVLYIQFMIVDEGLTEDRLASQVDHGMVSGGGGGSAGAGGGGYTVPLIMDNHELEVSFDYDNVPTQETTGVPELDMLHPPPSNSSTTTTTNQQVPAWSSVQQHTIE